MNKAELKPHHRQLGDYTIIKQIGEGSLGKVYLAEHRFLKKPYALKVLPEELASDRAFIQRFEKEVALLAFLDHPNIVKIHSVSFADGVYFLVTDCIVDSLNETKNLSQYLNLHEGMLSEEEIFQMAHQIASALDYAHQKVIGDELLAHRGIKLNNVLIGNSEEGIKVTLSDFGLTRVVGYGSVLNRTYRVVSEGAALLEKYYAISPDNFKLSKLYHSFLQNYAFLAPEQKATGDSTREADAKADVYAYGILIYYLIMNQFPEGFFELPSQIRPELKLNWDLLIYHCLQNDSKKRPSHLLPLLAQISADRSDKGQAFYWSQQSDLIDKNPLNADKNKGQAKEGSRPILKPQELSRPEYEPDPSKVFQVDTSVVKYTPKRQEILGNVEPLDTEMVVIEGGTFLRGSNNGGRDEMPRHAVNLSSFAFDIHPVTNDQFVRFLEALGGEKDANNNDIIRLRESRIKRTGGKLNIESGYAKHPVVGVTWYGAVAYAKWVGKRLPTEAEWEIASYGGLEEAQYPSGDDIERSQANFFSADTTAVMSYPSNSYGLYDMAGNVYEWCQDWYAYNYYDTSIQEPDDPKGPIQGVYRVLRGGCWKSLKEDLRSPHRHRNNPGVMNRTYGFRCAADVE